MTSCHASGSLAGRQGFELGARPVSNMVLARDFWFYALESQAVAPLRFVHCRPRESSRIHLGSGDILETVSRVFSCESTVGGNNRLSLDVLVEACQALLRP